MIRTDRAIDALRGVEMTKDYIVYPEGSVLIEMGNTKVICNATVEEGVPRFKADSGEGWVTAEYSMLPRATNTRNRRDISKLKKNSRSVEIQRLIGRSLRAVVDFKALGERTITLDCDVIQADGGTRTASITGAYVAMRLACQRLVADGVIPAMPLTDYLGAISVGIVEEKPMLDLCYEEDYAAEVDMNVVITGSGKLVEVQGTAEEAPFSRQELNALLDLAEKGIGELIEKQKDLLGE